MIELDAAQKAQYAHFQQEPKTGFINWFRYQRVTWLRELLARPEQVDLATFNREVWQFGPRIPFRNKRTYFYESYPDDPGWFPALRQAIEEHTLELHGNYLWHLPTEVYDNQNSNREQKADNIRRVLGILNDATLVPADKALALMRVRGFGAAVGTALVSIFHPDEYAVCNGRSTWAVNMLVHTAFKERHIPYDEVEQFQDVVGRMKVQLGARNLLELDQYFDYLYYDPLDQTFEPVPIESIPAEMDESTYPEGRRALRIHQSYERNRTLIKRAKENFGRAHDRLYCQVCGFDFAEVYGKLGDGYIEAHHTVPLSQLETQDGTRLSAGTRIRDLVMVCSNCHRMLHRGQRGQPRALLSIQALQQHMQQAADHPRAASSASATATPYQGDEQP